MTIYVKLLLVLIRKRTFIWLKQACGYHFKLSEGKTPVLSRCFVKNPSMLAYILATPVIWKKAPVKYYYKEVLKKYFCLGKESLGI